jgi:hypothetical protein
LKPHDNPSVVLNSGGKIQVDNGEVTTQSVVLPHSITYYYYYYSHTIADIGDTADTDNTDTLYHQER